MKLGDIPLDMDVAMEAEVEDLRDQFRKQQEVLFHLFGILKAKFPEEFPEEGNESFPDT